MSKISKILQAVKNIFVDIKDGEGRTKPSRISVWIAKIGYMKVRKKGSSFLVIELQDDGGINFKPMFQADRETMKTILLNIIKSI